jgi:hypothetical protein
MLVTRPHVTNDTLTSVVVTCTLHTMNIQHDPMDDTCPCDECHFGWLSDQRWLCLDCFVHTGVIGEYYMVRNDLWHNSVTEERGMLCVGCLESRIMRPLTPADFSDVPLNSIAPYHRSERLRNRLGMM